METGTNSFEIVMSSGKTIIGEFASQDKVDSFTLKDKSGKVLTTKTNEDGVVTITDKGYENVKFSNDVVETGEKESGTFLL